MGPLLTSALAERFRAGRRTGLTEIECSLDLGRSLTTVKLGDPHWSAGEHRWPYPEACKDRTIYYWDGAAFKAAARFTTALIKLVPTEWGPPTFEIDGIKMLPTAHVSPFADAEHKVGLIEPRGKRVLDTCGGLGYFAAWCQRGGASSVRSFEKNPDVLWLRSLNPWSPIPGPGLDLTLGDITEHIRGLEAQSVDAILHDPPRFGIAGELYSQSFYDQLARVLCRRGRLFHYTGTPNRLTTGRDVPNEVAKRLRRAGFDADLSGDGVLATRR